MTRQDNFSSASALRRQKRVDHRLAGGDERDIRSVTNHARFADFEAHGAALAKIVQRGFAEADVHGARVACGGFDCFARLKIIRRHDHVDIIDRSQRGQIMQRMVRRSQRAITHARADSDQLHRVIRIGDIVLDLFERAGRQETGGRHRVDNFSHRGDARGDADEILLGDSELDDLLGKGLAERDQFSRASRVGRHCDDLAVGFGELEQRGAELLKVWAAQFEAYPRRHFAGRFAVHRRGRGAQAILLWAAADVSSSSFNAAVYSASVGTP